MQLTGRQVAQIRDALLAAYNRDSLAAMVRVELDYSVAFNLDGDMLANGGEDAILKHIDWPAPIA